MVPPLFAGLVDDASLLPPGIVGSPEALDVHRKHRHAWYGGLVGAVLVPSSLVDFDLSAQDLAVGVVNDAAIGGLPAAVAKLRAAGAEVRQVEAAVARRGEDPQPGLGALRTLAADTPDLDVYAEIPLSWGLLAALDTVAGSALTAPSLTTATGRPAASRSGSTDDAGTSTAPSSPEYQACRCLACA